MLGEQPLTDMASSKQTRAARLWIRRGPHPLQAHPDPTWHVALCAMHVSPHAFPVVQTLQHDPRDPVESFAHPTVSGGPLAAASVSAIEPIRRTLRQIERMPCMLPPRPS